MTEPSSSVASGAVIQNNSHVVSACASRPLSHLPALDGLRGLAIVLVLAHNLATVLLPSTITGRAVEFALDIGWIGVQLFFVLSGFLITRILLQTRESANYFFAFFGRRMLRIFPLYYGALFVAFVVFPWLGKVSSALAHDQAHQVWLWLYLSNWSQLINFESHVFPHFWSLAIEEQFYLVWPLLVYRGSARQVLGLCLAVALASPALRVAMLWQGADPGSVYTYTVCRMDALAFGAAVAALLQIPGASERLLSQRDKLAWGAIALWSIGLVVTHGYPRTSALGQTLGYSWLAIVFAMAVLAVASGASSRSSVSWWEWALAGRPLRTLGKYSYAMYVFHKPLHDWIGKPLLRHFELLEGPSYLVALVYLLVATITTLAAAMLSYHLFERHFLAMKRWFVPQGRSVL